MAISSFASTTDLLDTLRVHKLLRTNQLRLLNNELRQHPGAGMKHVVDFAVEQKLLTRFQADLVLTGSAATLVLPPFILLDNAGSGYAGQVYQARGENDDQRYVIKILARGSRAGTPRVTQVLRQFASFRGPGVVEIAHVGTVSERTYLVWPEPAGGRSLEQVVEEKGKLPAKQVVHYGIQATRALHGCHQKDLFHGLLKAVDFHIDTAHKVVIKDLGMGFLLTLSHEDSTMDTMTSLGQLASGLDWASPESLVDQRDRTPLSDQYSLGCVLYYALTGQVPFPVVSKVRKMMAHQMEEPPALADLVPEVSSRLRAIVERLMRKVPAERYADMGEVEAAFRALAAKPPSYHGGAAAAKAAVTAGGAAEPAKPGHITKPASLAGKAKAGAAKFDEGADLAGISWVAWVVSVVVGLAACIIGWRLLA
jgi:hypothetical protein